MPHPIIRLYRRVMPIALRRPIGAVKEEIGVARRFAAGYGHMRSIRENACVDAAGDPLPWFTYPAIEFLESLDLSGAHVVEYGSGNSTLFFAARALRVSAVEHDPGWFERVSGNRLPPNVTLALRSDPHEYAGFAADVDGPVDLVVIDGQHRLECAAVACTVLAPGGLVVLDNSDGYPNVAAEIRRCGFAQVDLAGFGPQNRMAWRTSVFLRAESRIPRRPEVSGGTEHGHFAAAYRS